jgi:hypothetical protein
MHSSRRKIPSKKISSHCVAWRDLIPTLKGQYPRITKSSATPLLGSYGCETALCSNLTISVRITTYLTSHQGHLFSLSQIHNLAISTFNEPQTATHSPTCIVPILVLHKAVKKMSIQTSQVRLFLFGSILSLIVQVMSTCACVCMCVHVVAVNFVTVANPEML